MVCRWSQWWSHSLQVVTQHLQHQVGLVLQHLYLQGLLQTGHLRLEEDQGLETGVLGVVEAGEAQVTPVSPQLLFYWDKLLELTQGQPQLPWELTGLNFKITQ